MKVTKSSKRRRLIFRAWRIVNGRKLWAKDYGLRAWPIWLDA